MKMENCFHMEAQISNEIIHTLHHNLKKMRMIVVSTQMKSSLRPAEDLENSSKRIK